MDRGISSELEDWISFDGEPQLEEVVGIILNFAPDNRYPITAYLTMRETADRPLTILGSAKEWLRERKRVWYWASG